jgi:adenosine deaminase
MLRSRPRQVTSGDGRSWKISMLASDLHVHLDGSLRATTLVELGVRAGLWSEPEGRDRAEGLRFRPGMSLRSCLARFETTIGLLQTAPALSRAARELVEDSHADGVRHSEIRLCPALHTRSGLSGQAAVEAVLGGIEEGVSSAGRNAPGEPVSAHLVFSVLEGMREEEAGSIVELAIRFADAGVVGVDLAGDESLFDADRVRRPFEAARSAGLGITVHAGEGYDASHIEAAVSVLGARRIGHGTTAASDERVLDLLAEESVTVEVCLTSNVHTGAVASIEDHPLGRMLDGGVPVALATDNRFFSATTLSHEYEAAAVRLSVGDDDVERMVLESASAAFLPEREREELRRLYLEGLRSAPDGEGRRARRRPPTDEGT